MTRIGAALFLFFSVLPQARPSEHPLKYRTLWTWDTWISDYDPEGKSFLAEYKDLVDWMAKHEYNALVVWGFVDGRHGGEAAAKEIARYARAKGITLLPGVSTDAGAGGSYGGFALGLKDHPFNDEVQAKAVAAGKRPGEAGLCYSRSENREWLRRGVEWLLDSFDVDGINLEVLEGGIRCRCAECRERTAAQGGSTGPASFSDLSLCVPIVADVFRQKRPQGLVTYATYAPLWWDLNAQANDLLKRIPDAAVAQWNLELAVNDKVPPPVPRNLALLHGGGPSYHLRRLRPPAWAFTQYRCFDPKLDEIRRFCANVRRMNFEGFVVGAAGSPKNPDAELAYLAFIEFSRAPEMTLESFCANHVAPLYGEQAAPEVTRLFLAQPGVHEKGLPFWKKYDGGWAAGSAEAAAEAAKAFAQQAQLARAAAGKASADGKRRLDALVPILDEYRTICEAAAAAPFESKAKLAEFYERAGLPDDLYGYKRWKH